MNYQRSIHRDQRYLVVGIGATGFSVASYLLKKGYQCSVQDDREKPPCLPQLMIDFPHVEVFSGELTEKMMENIDCLVVSPGLSIRGELMKKVAQSGMRVIGDIELFAEAVDKPVLAITGSNGKSTVTDLLGEMIRADNKRVGVGGNFGVPALDLLQQEVDFYVLELSSFQLETTHSLKPLAATVLNISEDHMDRYDDLEDYQRCKKLIYTNSKYIISNEDDDLTYYGDRDIRFSLHHDDADFCIIRSDETGLAVQGEVWITTAELKLKGRHNWANCLAAMALAKTAGISQKGIIAALTSYSGLPHRSQWVADINGVSWINDSKATNPGAARAAIDGIDEPIILLAGGQGKGADMSILCASLKQHVKKTLLWGEDAGAMYETWQGCCELELVDDMPMAINRAYQIAQPDDVVLLSPACASFDQYSGFAQRGDYFCRQVRALSGTGNTIQMRTPGL